MRFYIIAMQFLTIIPLPFSVHCEKEDLGRSTAIFPLAGFTIGALLVGLNWLISPWLAGSLCDAILITALSALTGGLHLDGLADVCDGLAARGGREKFLAVMKDSNAGAVGAAALVLDLLLKWQALVAVPNEIKWQALLLFPALARFGQVLTLTGARHARADGLGATFVQGAGAVALSIAFVSTAAASFFLLGAKGIIAMMALCLFTAGGRMFFQRRLGGLTGDTVGYISELNEILVLIIFSTTLTLQ